MQGAGEIPMTWEEHLSPSSLSLENLEGLTEKVGTLSLQSLRKNRCGAAKKRTKKARLQRLLLGTLAVANLSRLKAVSHKTCRSPVHLGLKERQRRGQNMNPVQLDQNPQRAKDT